MVVVIVRALWLCLLAIKFEAQLSISMVNKRQLHFLHKESYTHIMCFIFG